MTSDKITNKHSSQPDFTRPPRFPDPLHLNDPHTMPVPGRCAALQFGRSHRRLLLPWRVCNGDCRNRRVHSGKQYVCIPTKTCLLLRDTDTFAAFPFVVFIIYGTHWGSLAYNQDPMHQITSAFTNEGGATGAAYNSSQSFHNITMYVVHLFPSVGNLLTVIACTGPWSVL